MMSDFEYSSEQLVQGKGLDFDQGLAARWNTLMENGAFRYGLEGILNKDVQGRYGFVAQLQLNRGTNRRLPESMLSLSQAFDENKFNFTRIDPAKELVFKLRKTDEERCGTDQLIINVSPFSANHSLLTPQVDLKLPQVLTEHAVVLALEVMFLSTHRDIRICFNSLCAYASVNHLHWHLYYFNRVLHIQKAGLEAAGEVSLLLEKDYPAPAFVFTLHSADQIQQTARNVHRLTSWLNKREIAHNVYIARGPDGEEDTEKENQEIRIFVWARESVLGAKDPGAFVMAVCELSGQILVYQDEGYAALTEEEIASQQRQAVVPVFNRIRDDVVQLFSG